MRRHPNNRHLPQPSLLPPAAICVVPTLADQFCGANDVHISRSQSPVGGSPIAACVTSDHTPLKSAPTLAEGEQFCGGDDYNFFTTDDDNFNIGRWNPNTYCWGLVVVAVIVLILLLVGSPPKPYLGPHESPPNPNHNPLAKAWKPRSKFNQVYYKKMKMEPLTMVGTKPIQPVLKEAAIEIDFEIDLEDPAEDPAEEDSTLEDPAGGDPADPQQ